LYRQLLEAKQKRHGNEHPSVAFALQNLGSCLGEQGKAQEAKELLSRAIVMRRRLLGENHPGYTASLESLANVLYRSGSHAEAEKLYREMLSLERKRFSNEHPAVLHAASCLAGALAAQNKYRDVESLLKDHLSLDFAHTPESASMLRLRAEALARAGRWKEAAADAALAVGHQPEDHHHYHTLAPLLIANNDLDAYARLCREIVKRFSRTTNVFVADRMAKDCLIHQSSNVDLKSVAALADFAVTQGKELPAFPFFQICKALAAYRERNFPDAAEWASKAGMSSFPYSAAESFAILAMAKNYLNEPEAARQCLAKANAIIQNDFPKVDSGDLGSDWRDWIIARSLLNEARSLIEGRTVSKDQFAEP
jgi:tetratricopeptide (TPR) repeat protein